MSAPSSDGRPSISSEPSATSSRTLHSRGSGVHTDHGEGSSAAGQHRSAADATDGLRLQRADTPLGRESIEEQDFARRRQRVRRSGGFLLDSSFSSGPRKTHAQHHAHVEDPKGKRRSRHADIATVDGHVEVMQQYDGSGLRVGKTRHNAHGSARVSTPERDKPVNPSQPHTIDPNQLVHMALNLSESRKRNLSAAPLLAPQSRAASSVQRDGSLSNNAPGGSLRHYLNEQRRASRNLSPIGGRGSPSRLMSSSMQRSASTAFLGSQGYAPSPATIARRNKARDYIELRMEFLRLLEYLPPLKLDASAPGNFVVSSNNVPGSPQAQLTRVPSYAGKQHELGRQYNPLQYIRNRRTRARERRGLDHASDEFVNVDEVRDWIDVVEQHSKRPGYRQDDGVLLPKLHDDHPRIAEQNQPVRPHKGWVFCPEELLADAYWLEQGDNKTIVENRHGRKIFPPREAQKPDLLQARASLDHSEKRRRSWVEGVAGIVVDPVSGNESEKGSERGRKRRLLPAFRGDSPRRGKHSRQGSRLGGRVDSDTSDSETDSGKRKPRIVVDLEHNTGPLALQLETMLKQQADKTQAKSPAIITPDTPNKWGLDHVDEPESRVSRDSLDVPRVGNGFRNMDHPGVFKMPPRSRISTTLSGDENDPRSSLEDLDHTAPNTPLQQKRFPHIGTKISPPPSRDSSVTRKSRRSKLNPFHSHENSIDHAHQLHHELSTGGLDKHARPRQTSEENPDSHHVGHAIMAAPNAVKSFLGHRKNESTISLPSPERVRRRDTPEAQSAVTRFFKGVKHEGSKVGDLVFRRDRAEGEDTDDVSDSHAEDYDTDLSVQGSKTKRPTPSRSTTAESIVTPTKNNRYHIDLPKFKSAHEPPIQETDMSPDGDHISRQNRERKSQRSPRFDKLAPPRMDLEKITTTSSQDTTSASSIYGDRIKKVLGHPGGSVLGGLPPTALRNAQGSGVKNRSSSQPITDSGRHWSIADDPSKDSQRKPNANRVTQADIARVHALFLCSGVKAQEIHRRAHEKDPSPPAFLVHAAATAKRELIPVPRKEEHVLAARILMRELELSTKSLSASTQQFRNQKVKELSDLITDLRSRVDSDLIPRIFEGGDTAVRITSEISGQGPLQVKQIVDDIDRMLRVRRRRMRWLRGFGWMMVEWALVAVMWWVWLVVVLVGSVKRSIGFIFGIVRWLLWL